MRVSNVNNYNPSVSFGGFKDKVPKCVVNGLTTLNETAANTKVFKKGIEFLSPKDNSFSHIIATESVILSSGYMICTAKSDKIDKKQKPQLIMSDAFTLTFSTLGAYFLDGKLKSSFDKFTEKYFAKHKDFYTDLGKKQQEKEGISPLKELMTKVGETVGKQGENLQKGLDDVSDTIEKHLKNIVGKKDDLKAFQITKEDLAKVQNEVKDVIVNSDSSKTAQEAIKKNISGLYNSSLARTAANIAKPWYGKVRKFSVFACSYRLIGPDISSLLTLRADKQREKLEKEQEVHTKQKV